ncbi:hypothetical protein [Mesorhizobium sp. STM 4661]|uniref:hypothetical protein n=1 Tax=Mesorhizobium sp. STM 4661 TaxID=1297570 RepID=UPI0012FA1608|nr:hypothetical protein [Mesorhizobium sp. STM 4661]
MILDYVFSRNGGADPLHQRRDVQPSASSFKLEASSFKLQASSFKLQALPPSKALATSGFRQTVVEMPKSLVVITHLRSLRNCPNPFHQRNRCETAYSFYRTANIQP